MRLRNPYLPFWLSNTNDMVTSKDTAHYSEITDTYQGQIINVNEEIMNAYLELQKEIMNWFQSTMNLFLTHSRQYGTDYYRYWIPQKWISDTYSSVLNSIAESSVMTATRLTNNMILANMEALRISLQQVMNNVRELSAAGMNAATTVEQVTPRYTDATINSPSSGSRQFDRSNTRENTEQIPTEDNIGKVQKAVSEQGGIEGQRKEVNVGDYSKAAAIGQLLKDLKFPTNKNKIIQFVQQQQQQQRTRTAIVSTPFIPEETRREVLSILQNIDDREEYQNVSDVTIAAGLIQK